MKVTMVEPSSSIVVRSERQYNPNTEERMCLRLHMYELVRDGLGYTWFYRNGRPLPKRDGDDYNKYRQVIRRSRAPLALGLLVPPRKYVIDPRVFIITGDYSPIFGGPPFASTVYCQQDPATGGAFCAQAALVMALGALSDRGARVEGSYALTYLGYLRRGANRIDIPPAAATDPGTPSVCILSDITPGDLWGCFSINGLSARDCHAVLRHPSANPSYDFRVSPHLASLQATEPIHALLARRAAAGEDFADRLAKRVIMAYLAARFPVVLFVDVNRWRGHLGKSPTPDKDSPHAVTLVGFRRWGPDVLHPAGSPPVAAAADGPAPDQPAALIAHDSGHRPFYEQQIDRCLEAAWSYGASQRKKFNKPEDRLPVMELLGVADWRVRTHPLPCLDDLCGYTAVHNRGRGTTANPVGPEQAGHAAAFADYVGGMRDHNFRVRLIHADDLTASLVDELPGPSEADGPLPREEIWERFTKAVWACSLPPERYWCVIGYDPRTDARPARVRHVWAFPAARP